LTVSDNSDERGISFIHHEPVTEPLAILGWPQGAGRRFVLCTLWSCTPLKRGSYWVRLFVDELIQLNPENVETIRRVLDERCANVTP
jgi:hypothetical protein